MVTESMSETESLWLYNKWKSKLSNSLFEFVIIGCTGCNPYSMV